LTREIVVVSGKGGVGKTTVSASLAYYLHSEGYSIVASDADVDTPSLKLLLPIKRDVYREDIEISTKAVIDESKCTKCLKCLEYCSYGAIEVGLDGYPKVIRYMCEGCGVCKLVCPSGAVKLVKAKTGELVIAETKYGFPMVTAQLEVGEHNSGLLVGAVRNRASNLSEERSADFILTDGAPGIGCPVIAALVGASYTIIVVEPTPQSLQGALRVKGVADHFKVPSGAIINKSNISSYVNEVRRALRASGVDVLGEVPLDYEVLRAIAFRMPILEFNRNSRASRSLLVAFKNLMDVLP